MKHRLEDLSRKEATSFAAFIIGAQKGATYQKDYDLPQRKKMQANRMQTYFKHI
jgi:hypothetical protein